MRGWLAQTRQRDADGLGARRHEEVEHGELLAQQHGLRRQLGAGIGGREHYKCVAEVFDIPGAVLQERIADNAVRSSRRLPG